MSVTEKEFEHFVNRLPAEFRDKLVLNDGEVELKGRFSEKEAQAIENTMNAGSALKNLGRATGLVNNDANVIPAETVRGVETFKIVITDEAVRANEMPVDNLKSAASMAATADAANTAEQEKREAAHEKLGKDAGESVAAFKEKIADNVSGITDVRVQEKGDTPIGALVFADHSHAAVMAGKLGIDPDNIKKSGGEFIVEVVPAAGQPVDFSAVSQQMDKDKQLLQSIEPVKEQITGNVSGISDIRVETKGDKQTTELVFADHAQADKMADKLHKGHSSVKKSGDEYVIELNPATDLSNVSYYMARDQEERQHALENRQKLAEVREKIFDLNDKLESPATPPEQKQELHAHRDFQKTLRDKVAPEHHEDVEANKHGTAYMKGEYDKATAEKMAQSLNTKKAEGGWEAVKNGLNNIVVNPLAKLADAAGKALSHPVEHMTKSVTEPVEFVAKLVSDPAKTIKDATPSFGDPTTSQSETASVEKVTHTDAATGKTTETYKVRLNSAGDDLKKAEMGEAVAVAHEAVKEKTNALEDGLRKIKGLEHTQVHLKDNVSAEIAVGYNGQDDMAVTRAAAKKLAEKIGGSYDEEKNVIKVADVTKTAASLEDVNARTMLAMDVRKSQDGERQVIVEQKKEFSDKMAAMEKETNEKRGKIAQYDREQSVGNAIGKAADTPAFHNQDGSFSITKVGEGFNGVLSASDPKRSQAVADEFNKLVKDDAGKSVQIANVDAKTGEVVVDSKALQGKEELLASTDFKEKILVAADPKASERREAEQKQQEQMAKLSEEQDKRIAPVRKQVVDHANEKIKKYDTNHDGKLDNKEMSALAAALSNGADDSLKSSLEHLKAMNMTVKDVPALAALEAAPKSTATQLAANENNR